MASKFGTVAEERQLFYNDIAQHNLSPLWESLHSLVPKTPKTPILPIKWDYDGVVRDRLLRAGEVVTAEEAERRVLILENPGLPGKASITHSLYAGLQLVKPGEVARAHRHTQSALRFVIEGGAAYTAVDGERTIMHPGDFVLTPSWRWHDHGNDSNEPIVWLDGLDIPTIGFFDAGFAETGESRSQMQLRSQDDSAVRYGNNMLPVDWKPGDASSPILNYPYERSAQSLYALSRNGDPDACHGYKMRFVNPASGSSPMPTISAFIQALPKGMTTAPYRSTDSTVFVVVEGEGESLIGDQRFIWKPRDIFVVPSWHQVTHSCHTSSTLFSFSDRSVQEMLGIWREARFENGNEL
jgi:gentisate 1,2-dioxygenase